MINLRGMKKCHPCMEFKQCELNNEYSWLTCFLIINLDLPTTDKVMKFLTHNRPLDPPPPPPPPFRPSSYIKRSKAGDCVQSQRNSQSSPASKNCALIHHESAKSFRHGQSLISFPSYGYCDVFFVGNFFWKCLVPGNLTCVQETRWLRDSVRFFGPIQTPNFSCT